MSGPGRDYSLLNGLPKPEDEQKKCQEFLQKFVDSKYRDQLVSAILSSILSALRAYLLI